VNTYSANLHNNKQEPRDVNVMQLRILTDIFRIFMVQKGEIKIVLKIVRAMQIKRGIFYILQHNLCNNTAKSV
jgi:hypothetical protein